MRYEKVTVKIMKRSVIGAACFLSVRLNEIPNLQLRLLNVALTVQRVYRLLDLIRYQTYSYAF